MAEEGQPDGAKAGRTITVDRHQNGLPFARIALAGAAAIALVAVGLQFSKGGATGDAAVASAPADQPLSQQADVGTMIARLEKKLADTPDDAEGWRMLGWSYYGTGRFADAVKAYRRATALDPANAEGWSALGEAIVLALPSGQPAAITPEADAAFRKAVSIDPANPRARYFLGVKKDLAGDHRGAIDDWIALLKDTPAGAPWEGNVRQTIEQTAAQNNIDLAGRMPAPAVPPGSAATDAIPGPTREDIAAASALPPGQQDAMVRGMVDSLAAKLKADPKNADGWLRLIRSYTVLGDRKAAAGALKDARAAFAGDAPTLARIDEGARQLGIGAP
ncbi:tetratricopeptide repeat protein [Sphingomonas fennica]|uniref:tetratricopeptide repeat protein n=1 Tax=Edaphosphingomonas fennica TaxID=114404 RepID=UPI001B865D62|nr:tetratricopeptide repeat protein [Sphingomonas fennica]